MSTINRELAIQLAKHPSVEVSVYLPQCSEEDKQDAASYNAFLIRAEAMPGFDNPVDWLSCLPEGHAVDCVIGYGAVLGRQVQLIKRHYKCKWIQIVPTAPEEQGMYRSRAVLRAEKLHQDEVKLCEKADQVVAVGPKLADVFRRYLRSCRKDQDVLNLTPGIFSEFANVTQAAEERETFSVLMFGPDDNRDFKLNGYDIAARAIAELKDEPKPYKLLFVGAPRGEEEKVKDLLLQQGIDRLQLTVRCFCEGREKLARLFCEVDLAIMPSRTEGFGLATLEALSAGLPVLVSGNSGLGEALKNVLYGSNCVVESDDPNVWAKAIKAVRQKDRKMRLEEIKILRESYAFKYNWENECDKLVERMLDITPGGKCEKFHTCGAYPHTPTHTKTKKQRKKKERLKSNFPSLHCCRLPFSNWRRIIHLQSPSKLTEKQMDKVRRIIHPKFRARQAVLCVPFTFKIKVSVILKTIQ